MGCSSVETCKPICDLYGGEIQEKSRVCMFDAYLNELCYRVILDSNGNYKIDLPPAWDLYPGTIMPGCEQGFINESIVVMISLGMNITTLLEYVRR